MAAARNGAVFVATNAYLESKKALSSNLSRQYCRSGRINVDSIPKHQQLVVSPTGENGGLERRDAVVYISETLSSQVSRADGLGSSVHEGVDVFQIADNHFHGLGLNCIVHTGSAFVHSFDPPAWPVAVKPHQSGLDWSNSSLSLVCCTKGMWTGDRKINGLTKASFTDNYVAEPSRKCILLDIEGTTTPISFVTDVLFPYARNNVHKHLNATYDSEETQDDIKLLCAQVKDDLEQGIDGSVPIPPADTGKEAVIDALVANVEAMIKADRKITALKQLQGHIWRTGFESKELQGVVFEDVPEAFKRWHAMCIKVYIYSSGSREAQRLIFGNTTYGDLRKYLCGFFDTMMGNKKESRSYFEIWQSVGVDKPSEILFLTDVFQEAVAAKAAGLEVIISVRPGNGPLPENHGFKTIESFSEI